MMAAEEAFISFETVADYSGAAMLAYRRQHAYRAFKAVKCMCAFTHSDHEGFVVVVTADFATDHLIHPL